MGATRTATLFPLPTAAKPAKEKKPSKKETLAAAVAKAVGAGKVVAVETVDFNDPNRPKTCIEVDFPIIPVNQVAVIEGNAGKPIYQMSKWWARRRSSVFRSMLLASAMKAPKNEAEAAKAVWDVYYANHQKRGALKRLKVADIFMGGGTTIVEGSRLGMKMFGTDLNPVAWFVVKNELAKVDPEAVKGLLTEIEADVKPRIIPFYACDCPRGHKGTWTHIETGKVMGADFDPLAITREKRKEYRYDGPEIIYVFWAKHGPCQNRECGHRTPIFGSPVVAVKTISIKAWEGHKCGKCRKAFEIEEDAARMAPGVPLVVSESEKPFAVLDPKHGVECPHCGYKELVNPTKKATKKKIDLTLLVHPAWLKGAPRADKDGNEYGGSATDTAEATARWNAERARTLRLVEVRGALPDEVVCPETKARFSTSKGTVPKKSTFECQACGRPNDVLEAVKASGKNGPFAAYAIQGYCPTCDAEGRPYGGRFFMPVTDPAPIDAALREWTARKDADLAGWWPTSEVPFGFMTGMANGDIRLGHGFTHWWKMFNPRQLLVHAQLLRAVVNAGGDRFPWEVREYVLGALQQYLRNQNMFCFWDISRDCMAPALSNANYHPKSQVVENCVFATLGRGNWKSSSESLDETAQWSATPWETVCMALLAQASPALAGQLTGKSEKVECGDPVASGTEVACASSTDLSMVSAASHDLVITDPPFGGLLYYAELSDFFYVWLRLVLKERYPDYFTAEYTPKALEAIASLARKGEDPDAFYKRIFTECLREANRILKPGGILAFTFHHSEDEPWVAVLESIFDAGFYLEATYPIRSDETKGEGEFGSKQIEYDIIHVCRKRQGEPERVSWGKMRREVIEEVRHLQAVIEHHSKAGLPKADLQVIRRGKALEYYSRHYGTVFVDETRIVSVRDALLGINQLLDEDSGDRAAAPPATAEPFTRQFLRIFGPGKPVPRDQMQKHLRGTGIAPAEFEERGWCVEEKKTYRIVPPLEIARAWHRKHRRNMSDYDQAMFLVGACFEGSGINATETLNNENFRPHPALGSLLDWHAKQSPRQDVRNAAARSLTILRSWERSHKEVVKAQLSLFGEEA